MSTKMPGATSVLVSDTWCCPEPFDPVIAAAALRARILALWSSATAPATQPASTAAPSAERSIETGVPRHVRTP